MNTANGKGRLRIGVIGCGKITVTRHAPEYAANELCEVAGFFDYLPERAEAMAKEYGGRVYPSVEALLADGSIDAVSICTANATHAALTVAALHAGKHVLCEKPLATTLTECEEMLSAARAAGRRLFVAHNQRLSAVHQKAKALLDGGAIGKPISFKTCFGHSGPDNWSIDAGTGNWFFDKSRSAFGAVADLGIHKIDLMRYLLGSDIACVQAILATLDKSYPDGTPVNVDDNATVLCRMKNGVLGSVTVSWTYYADEENDTTIYGTDGKMHLSPKDECITVYRKNGESERIAAPQGGSTGVIDTFLQAVASGEPSVLDAEAIYPSMQAMMAAIRSSEEGRRIDL